MQEGDPIKPFDEYLRPQPISVGEQRRKTGSLLTSQRDKISQLFDKLRPNRVLCMGAGYLNDIPFEKFAAKGAAIHLVDWISNATREAYLYDLIERVDQQYVCFVCRHAKYPIDYCKNHSLRTTESIVDKIGSDPLSVCDNFEPDSQKFPICRNYQPGTCPVFHEVDVTQGRAIKFAAKIPRILSRSKTPRQSFAKAVNQVKLIKTGVNIPVENASIELITSSMVASQFDYEPFMYFLSCVQRKFGREEIINDAKILAKWEIDLRNDLFRLLMEGHCREMVRLLSPNGRIYFSVEAAHREKDSDAWFQPETFPATLEIVGKYFYFDLDILPETLTSDIAEAVAGGTSVIQSYVLRPKEPASLSQ